MGFGSVKLSFSPALGLDDVLELHVSEIMSIQPLPEDLLAALPVSLWYWSEVGKLLERTQLM